MQKWLWKIKRNKGRMLIGAIVLINLIALSSAIFQGRNALVKHPDAHSAPVDSVDGYPRDTTESHHSAALSSSGQSDSSNSRNISHQSSPKIGSIDVPVGNELEVPSCEK